MDGAPTIRTLAKAAGVSKATVSLALRNHPRIRPEVRLNIQRLAADAGYHSNAVVANLLSQLRASKTHTCQSTIGLLCIAKDPSELEAVSTFRSWIKGCQDRAREQGYGVDRLWLYEPRINPNRLTHILDSRGIVGLVVVGFYEGEVLSKKLDPIWNRSVSIALGTRPTWPIIDSVSNNQYVTAYQAVRRLAALGYRRVGLCLGNHVDDVIENMFSAGFLAAHRRLGIDNEMPVFNLQPRSKASFSAWLKKYQPDAILTIHAEVAEWLASIGYRIPEDIGLAQLDKTLETAQWAGMQQNSELIGRAAVDMLVGQLHRNELGVPLVQRCMHINSTWSPGSTLRKRRRATEGKPGVSSPAK